MDLRHLVRVPVAAAALGATLLAAQLPPGPGQPPDSTAQAIVARAQAQGRLRVIVTLRTAFVPEPLLETPQSVGLQRNAIGQARTTVLARLAAPSSIRAFETLPLMALDASAADIASIAAMPEVAAVVEDVVDRPLLSQSVPLIGATQLFARGLNGAGQAVAVLDTGVDKNHTFLSGRVVSEACYSTTSSVYGSQSLCTGGQSQSTDNNSALPCNISGCEHGTHVAGIVAGRAPTFSGVAPGASLIAVQVFSRFTSAAVCGGSTPCIASFSSDQIAGLERVYALRSTFHVAAANLSLGGGGFTTACDTDPRKPIIDTLRAAGIATVVSSGNDGYTDRLSAPACVSSAVSVGSTGDGSGGQTADRVSSFSNSSVLLDLLAPGAVITSSVPGNAFASFAGTSMAAPHVAGLFALLKAQQPALSVTDALTRVQNTGLPVTDSRNGLVQPRIRADAAVAAGCTFGVSPGRVDAGAGGGSFTATVTASLGCAWTATSPVSWVTITSGASGVGNGVVGFAVAPNGLSAARSGVLRIAGIDLTVNQAGVPCGYTLSPTGVTVGPAGGPGTFGVTTTVADCAWTAVSGATWINTTSTGVGSGTVAFTTQVNPLSASRSGTIRVGTATFTVTQTGITCALTVTPKVISIDGAGGVVPVTVTANAADCRWSSSSQTPWITVPGGTSTGSGVANLTIAANSSTSSRIGTVVVGGDSITVNQGGFTCSVNASPLALTLPAAGGSAPVTVTANGPGCAWSAASSSTFVSVLPTAGAGPGVVTVSAQPYALSTPRVGSITVAGRLISVTQSGVACGYTLTPTGASFASAGGSGAISVSATAADCAWSASSDATWIRASGAATGSGTVTFNVAPQPLSTARSGAIKIGTAAFTIQQAGVACSFTVAPRSFIVGAAGGTVTPTVTATAADCAWSTFSQTAWIGGGGTGVGTGGSALSVAANGDSRPRVGTATVAGWTVTVTQAGTGTGEDFDNDALPDAWERTFGLNPASATGFDGPDGDPDGDQKSNLREYLDGTHPRGFVTRYLAEGATGSFFDTRISLANLQTGPARVLLRFLPSGAPAVAQPLELPAQSRRTVVASAVAGLANSEFSTIIESDQPILADRTMSWNRAKPYGSHAETAITAPSNSWYLAEGSTAGAFDLFYLFENPGDAPSTARVRYLLPTGAPIEQFLSIAPQSRSTVWVDRSDPRLASTDVSAVIDVVSGPPIIVERAMYMSTASQVFAAGHESAGVTAPSTRWFLAEGATGPFFDLFVLIANPTAAVADVRATYLLEGGTTIERRYSIAPNQRFNVWVDLEDARLANAAVSTIVESLNGVPIVVERSMWWPGPTAAQWYEAANSAGSTASGTYWGVADGESGGPGDVTTYLLVANTSPVAGSVAVTLLFEDGSPLTRLFNVAATSRLSLNLREIFPESASRRFASTVRSLGAVPAQIVVERAMYSSWDGVFWSAGTSVLATRMQ